MDKEPCVGCFAEWSEFAGLGKKCLSLVLENFRDQIDKLPQKQQVQKLLPAPKLRFES